MAYFEVINGDLWIDCDACGYLCPSHSKVNLALKRHLKDTLSDIPSIHHDQIQIFQAISS